MKRFLDTMTALINLPSNFLRVNEIMPKHDQFYVVLRINRHLVALKAAWAISVSYVTRNCPDEDRSCHVSSDVEWGKRAARGLTNALIHADIKTDRFVIRNINRAIGRSVCDEHKWTVMDNAGRDVWRDKEWLAKNVMCWNRLQVRIVGSAFPRRDEFNDDCADMAAAFHWLQNEFLK